MKRLREALSSPHQAQAFCLPGKGPVAIAKKLGLQGDFSGCYVLVEKDEPIYVGISRSVLARLRQHLTGKTHFDASLVYAIAQHRLPTKGQRGEVMALPHFQAEFEGAQTYLRSLDIAFVAIENPLELYVSLRQICMN